MAVFKCKMCGGALEINNKETIAVCEYCGSQQTLPKLDNERKVNLYDRASHFRRNNEFDKATRIYEQILDEDSTDAESYWSLVLCRFGIEYVEDPATRKRVPTVNRAQFTSVFDDENYKLAIKYADGYQRGIYENEANVINEIQRGILDISQNEEPFDVFICYKQTDDNGCRTQDSVLANDIYHVLTQEGFKVFFSGITLEDKLGSAYEPYIFAALNSAKVMIVLGTKPEFFKAPWVRNEWSRYLALVKQGQRKILIPAYKDMDPYELPEEFSHLQAQDMSKIGFMHDLIRGIKKIIQTDITEETNVRETVIVSGNTNATPLLKRAFMFLEDGEWNSADEYCEKVLDIDPENAMAYVGKLLLELRISNQEELREQKLSFENSNNYKKAVRFADDELKNTLMGYVEYINLRNENMRLEATYYQAKKMMAVANNEVLYKEAAYLFWTINGYRDSRELERECNEKAEIARKDEILIHAKALMSDRIIANNQRAITLFTSISGWKDADEKTVDCLKLIEMIKVKEEAEHEKAIRKAKRKKIRVLVLIFIVCVVIATAILVTKVILPYVKYNKAVELMEEGRYQEAIKKFEKLEDYKDSEEKIIECRQGILRNAKKGDVITFGIYEQDNNYGNKEELIEWVVLDVKDGKALLLSKYALACQPYHMSDTANISWSNCYIRVWLNKVFIDSAFTEDEQTWIMSTEIYSDGDNKGETQDKIFLLSIEEVEEYLVSDREKQCSPTNYAETNGVKTNRNGKCIWWVRLSSKQYRYAPCITNDGEVDENGRTVDDDYIAVRPAMWIDLSSLQD